MRTANRLRFSFGIMLGAVALIGAAAVLAMFRTAAATTVELQRSFQAMAALETLSEHAREYSVAASGFAATATVTAEDGQKLAQLEGDLDADLSRLESIDPASAAQAREAIVGSRDRSRAVLQDFGAVEAPAADPVPVKQQPAVKPRPRPRPGRKGRPAAPTLVPAEPTAVSPASAALEEVQLRLLLLQSGRRASLELGGLHEEVAGKLRVIREAQQQLVEQRIRETSRRAYGFMALFLVLGLGACAAVGLLFLGVRRRTLGPLQALADSARRVAAERDLTVQIPMSGDDEVQDLGRAFAEMMETLRSITTELRSATDRLLAASSDLGGITRAQGDGMARQASALEEARRTSSTLREASRSAAARADGVLHVAQRAEELGRAGEKAMGENLASVEVIQGQTRQVVERIARLATSAQRIAAITGTVKDLADQSNVLALNATIEASRAGEAGAGFAVVAREIRSLADRSIRATAEVRTVLAEVLAGVRDSANLVEAATSGLAEGTARTRQLGDSVAGLSGIVRENLGAVREIAGDVASQDAGIGQISAAVEDLSQMMDETLRTSRMTGDAAAVLREVSEQVSAAAKLFRL